MNTMMISEQIDLQYLPRGVYHILIVGHQPVYQGKLIVQ